MAWKVWASRLGPARDRDPRDITSGCRQYMLLPAGQEPRHVDGSPMMVSAVCIREIDSDDPAFVNEQYHKAMEERERQDRLGVGQ